jgi:hypothetical protein
MGDQGPAARALQANSVRGAPPPLSQGVMMGLAAPPRDPWAAAPYAGRRPCCLVTLLRIAARCPTVTTEPPWPHYPRARQPPATPCGHRRPNRRRRRMQRDRDGSRVPACIRARGPRPTTAGRATPSGEKCEPHFCKRGSRPGTSWLCFPDASPKDPRRARVGVVLF